jgi:hypothetical protein
MEAPPDVPRIGSAVIGALPSPSPPLEEVRCALGGLDGAGGVDRGPPGGRAEDGRPQGGSGRKTPSPPAASPSTAGLACW